MEVRDLKVGDWFEKGDGGICRLDELSDMRARIYVINVKKKKVVNIWGDTVDAKGREYSNVSPSTTVVRVLDGSELRKQPNAEGRGRGDFMKNASTENGLSACAVIRWMGVNDFSVGEAKAGLSAMKFSKLPNDATIRRQLHIGRVKEEGRGEPAKLSAEQQKELNDAAKIYAVSVKIEEKKSEKTPKVKKTTKKAKTSKKGKGELKFSKEKQVGKAEAAA